MGLDLVAKSDLATGTVQCNCSLIRCTPVSFREISCRKQEVHQPCDEVQRVDDRLHGTLQLQVGPNRFLRASSWLHARFHSQFHHWCVSSIPTSSSIVILIRHFVEMSSTEMRFAPSPFVSMMLLRPTSVLFKTVEFLFLPHMF